MNRSKKYGPLLLVLLLTFSTAKATSLCDSIYWQIGVLDEKIDDAIRDKSKWISGRIRRAKKYSRQILQLAYQAIKEEDCNRYDLISLRIVELELQLKNYDQAEKIALERLDKMYPGWRNISKRKRIAKNDLTAISRIPYWRSSVDYYQSIREFKGYASYCDTRSYDGELMRILEIAQPLNDEFGPEYCYRFLETQTILLNQETSPRSKEIRREINQLIIQVLLNYHTREALIEAYESALLHQLTPMKPRIIPYGKPLFFVWIGLAYRY